MKRALALVLVLALALSLVACGGAPATSEPAESGAASGEAAVPGTSMTNGLYTGTADPDMVTVNIASEPPEMNSITTTDSTAINVMRHVLEGLTSLDQNNQPVPGVAESWTTSEDGLVWTFTLRQDSVWSNGEPVTANDFVFALRRLFTASTGAQYAGTWATYIAGADALLAADPADEAAVAAAQEALGVKAIEDHTLEITLNNPCAYFLSMCAFPNFYPVNEAAYMAAGAEDGYALDMDKMLFNGPYVMTEWQHEDHVTLTKNDNYWDKANKAFIPTVKMVMISDSGAGFNAFRAGEVDMIGLNGEQVVQMQAENCTPAQYADGTPAYLEYNTVTASTPALSNAKVRRALTMAVDAQSYITNVAKSSYLPADGMVPPVVGGGAYTAARGSLFTRPVDDYSEVKALFEEGCAEAGVDPATINLRYLTDEGDNAYKMAAFIQNQWKEHLGIECTIESMPFKARLQAQSDKDYDVCLALWGPDYDDAMTYLDMFMTDNGNNHTGWSNAEYDALIEQAYAEGDPAKHQELMIQAETLLMNEMPIGPVYFRVRDYITSDKFTGVVRTAFQDGVMNYATLVG